MEKEIKTKKYRKIDDDEVRDIAILITNKLINLGYVPDCTDTDNEAEFEVQDVIFNVIKRKKFRIKNKKE